MTDDLVEWLRAQLDEDERIARAADGGTWLYERQYVAVTTLAAAEHITIWGPDRVLREVEALRTIVDLHSPRSCYSYTDTGEERIQCEYCAGLCHSRSGLGCEEPVDALYPCDTIRLVAAIFSDRPGYREAWRP